ncbi:MAG: TolC family protein [Chitinophagaceae bacterium]|jgi:outer membrane protein TolC|nr:TolC family protein [Chitinophagaceae bacterium]
MMQSAQTLVFIFIQNLFQVKKYVSVLSTLCMLMCVSNTYSQTQGADFRLSAATLDNCVQYALKNYPLIKQNELDEQITERQIKSKLADWYPQLGINANYQYNFQLLNAGTNNASTVALGATQNIFNRDVLLAFKSKNDVRLQAHQTSIMVKIDVAVNVSKAFYNVLLTQRQLEVLQEDTVRLSRNLKDAYNLYKAGTSDKVDYKQATIALNNSTAQLKATREQLKANTALLKQLMNYPANEALHLVYDSKKMEQEINVDTASAPVFENRIEYQQLLTEKRLQEANLSYQKWNYIPTVSAFANYNLNYFNNSFSGLYKDNFPQSYAGITVGFPIFQGGKRTQNIRAAELQLSRVDYDIINLKNQIITQYEQVLAEYKSNLINYYTLRDNLQLAQEVYNTIALQYKAGIKKYLDVINAQTDLRAASINYANALYQVLSSKLDVEKSLGNIRFN